MLSTEQVIDIIENNKYEKLVFEKDTLCATLKEGGSIHITKINKEEPPTFIGKIKNYMEYKIELIVPEDYGFYKVIETWILKNPVEYHYRILDILYFKKYHEYKKNEEEKYAKYFPK